MKTSRSFFGILILIASSMLPLSAQSKVIMITQNGDSLSRVVDTLNNSNGYAFFFNEDFSNVPGKIDSLLKTQRSNIDSVMRIMAIKLDSLQENISMFSFDMGDDFFNSMIPPDSIMNKMMNVNMDMKVEIDTLADGTVVKNMVITGFDNGTGKSSGNNITIASGNGKEGDDIVINEDEDVADFLSPVPVSDLHILKKAGFSTDMFSSEPLEFKNENININRKETEKSDILELEVKADLQKKGKATVTLVNKDGKIVDQNKIRNSEKINIKYKLDNKSAPYFLVITMNKKAWAKKVEF